MVGSGIVGLGDVGLGDGGSGIVGLGVGSGHGSVMDQVMLD